MNGRYSLIYICWNVAKTRATQWVSCRILFRHERNLCRKRISSPSRTNNHRYHFLNFQAYFCNQFAAIASLRMFFKAQNLRKVLDAEISFRFLKKDSPVKYDDLNCTIFFWKTHETDKRLISSFYLTFSLCVNGYITWLLKF